MFAKEAQLHAHLTKYLFVFVHIRDIKQSNLAGKIIELTVLWNLQSGLRNVSWMLRFCILVFVIFTDRW